MQLEMKSSNSSLTEHASVILENLSGLQQAFPELSAAAESVHQCFVTIQATKLNIQPDSPFVGLITMLVGAHTAWIDAYLLAMSGKTTSGLAEFRRCVELTAYAMKAYSSEDRMLTWIKQGTEVEARRKLSMEFSLPLSYQSVKYQDLRPLMVAYEHASDYGIHGNLAAVGPNLVGIKNGLVEFSHQVEPFDAARQATFITLLGFRAAKIFGTVFSGFMETTKTVDSLLDYAQDQTKKARLRLASEQYKGATPAHIVAGVLEDNLDEVNKSFEQLVQTKKGDQQTRNIRMRINEAERAAAETSDEQEKRLWESIIDKLRKEPTIPAGN